jgi:predicted RNA-binding protein with PUA-like domain
MAEESAAPYWVFVCNPQKWAIDRFLDRGIERDTWGVRPSDQARFAPGQLGIVRVGVDRRSAKHRKGKPKLKSGIYALCEVESKAYPGTGAHDEFWASGAGRNPGWPTVDIRYLRTYRTNPLTIERLRRELPEASPQLLKGFEGASFPISADDFHAVMELLGEEIEAIPTSPDVTAISPDKLAELEAQFLHASPEVKERVSRTIERGPMGALVKRANGFRCQICAALGLDPIGFKKKSGELYVEAHHAMPVSKKQIGCLAASNILTLCANHHREVHFGCVEIIVTESGFDISIAGKQIHVPRFTLSASK